MIVWNAPSDFALRNWLYVIGMGTARWPAHFGQQHQDDDGFLLHFVWRGRVSYQIRGKPHTVGVGEVCFMDMSDPIRYENEGPKRAEFYWVRFSHVNMLRFHVELKADRSPVFRVRNPKRMRSIFADLMRLTTRKPLAWEVECSARLTLLLAELFVARGSDEPTKAPSYSRSEVSGSVRKAIESMMSTYHRPITVREIAGEAGMSVSRLSHLFHLEMGTSLIEYLNQLRLDQAKPLLAQTQRPVAQIAKMVGFPDQNYFARVFRKAIGLSPSQFRQEENAKAGKIAKHSSTGR